MNQRTKGKSKMNEATNELKEFYSEFEKDFTSFFQELQSFTITKKNEVEKQFKI